MNETLYSISDDTTRIAVRQGRSMVNYLELVIEETGDHGDDPLAIFQIRSDLKTPKGLSSVKNVFPGVVLYLLWEKLEMERELQQEKDAQETQN